MVQVVRAAALIPVFNNGGTIGDVIKGALNQIPDVLVVDDGSTDGTAEAIAAFEDRIRTIRHLKNFGKGRSLRSGFELLASIGYTHAISLDADGQHFPEDIPRILEASVQSPEALIIGEREMKGLGAPRANRVGHWFSNTTLRLLGGARLRDSQSGFRSYPLALMSRLDLKGDRFDLELEVLLKAARSKIPIQTVPIQATYDPEGGRVTHFRPLRDFFRITCRVARILLRG